MRTFTLSDGTEVSIGKIGGGRFRRVELLLVRPGPALTVALDEVAGVRGSTVLFRTPSPAGCAMAQLLHWQCPVVYTEARGIYRHTVMMVYMDAVPHAFNLGLLFSGAAAPEAHGIVEVTGAILVACAGGGYSLIMAVTIAERVGSSKTVSAMVTAMMRL